MLFSDLYTHGSKIFNMPEIMFRPVPNYIYSFISMTRDKKIEGKRFSKVFEKISVTIEVIKSEDEYSLHDLMLHNDFPAIISILPNSIDLNAMDNKVRISHINDMYSYWIDYVKGIYRVKENSTLDKIFKLAPLVLTFKTISELNIPDLNINDFMSDEDKKLISEKQLKECFSYSIEELLDKYGIITIINEVLDN